MRKTIFDNAREDGFVLIAVIWIAGLMAVIATAFVITVKSHTLIARNVVFNTKAEYIADGMAKLVASRLVRNTGDGSQKFNGVTGFCQWSQDAIAGFRVQDQGGLVDLNLASPELLAALFAGLHMPAGLINSIQDYRDPDLVSVDGGAEPEVYAGKNFGPKNASFVTVEELDQVPGIDDAVFARLSRFLTVHSQQTGFDLTHAPAQLLTVLGTRSAAATELAQFSSVSPSKIFGIDVVVKTKQGATFYRKAIFVLVLQPDRPFTILSWQQGRSATDWTFPSAAQKVCVN
jgi:general secretion pathway protein K